MEKAHIFHDVNKLREHNDGLHQTKVVKTGTDKYLYRLLRKVHREQNFLMSEVLENHSKNYLMCAAGLPSLL